MAVSAASIARMYIRTLAEGNPPAPYAACRRECSGCVPQKGENVRQKETMRHLHIELTPALARQLSDQAKQCGLSKRAYIVRLIEGTPIRARPSQEIKELRDRKSTRLNSSH